MNRLTRIFRHGRVARWHTNPDLAHTRDTIDGHMSRTARIILALHPMPSPKLIFAALTHDDGEHVTGDLPPAAKRRLGFKVALDIMERNVRDEIWGPIPITKEDERWLVFADRLDAWMWVQHHAPRVLHEPEWVEAQQWLKSEAIGIEALDAYWLITAAETAR